MQSMEDKVSTDSAVASAIGLLNTFQSEAELKWKGDRSIMPLLDSLLSVRTALAANAHLFVPETASQSHNRIREHFYLCVACSQLLPVRLELMLEDVGDGSVSETASVAFTSPTETISIDMARRVAVSLAGWIDELKAGVQLDPIQRETWLQQRTTRSMLQLIREQHVSLVTGRDHLPSFAGRLATFPLLGAVFGRCRTVLESAYRTAVVEPRERFRDELEAKHRSQLIDQQLAANSEPEAVTALVMGLGTIEMPNCLLHAIDAFNETDRDTSLDALKKAVTFRMNALLRAVHEVPPENLIPETSALAAQTREKLPDDTEIADEHAVSMFERFWNSAAFRADHRGNRLLRCYDAVNLLDEVFDNLGRIWKPGYVPSLLDRIVIRQNQKPRSYGVLRMSTVDMPGRQPIILADGTRRCCQRKSIFRMFEPHVVIFTLDVTIYNAPIFEGDPTYQILHAFEFFDSIVTYREYAEKPLIVLLTGITEFKALLRHVPLAKVLPDYKGRTDDADAAVNHILSRLLASNTNKRPMYHLTCDISDPELVPRLAEVIREADLAAKARKARGANRPTTASKT